MPFRRIGPGPAGRAEPGRARGRVGVQAALGRAAGRLDPDLFRFAAFFCPRREDRPEPGHLRVVAGDHRFAACRYQRGMAGRATRGTARTARSPVRADRRAAAGLAGTRGAGGGTVLVGVAAGCRRVRVRRGRVTVRRHGAARLLGLRVRAAPGVHPAVVRVAAGHVVAGGRAARGGVGGARGEPRRAVSWLPSAGLLLVVELVVLLDEVLELDALLSVQRDRRGGDELEQVPGADRNVDRHVRVLAQL